MVATLKLTYRDGRYLVNKHGDQDGEYVRLEDYTALREHADGLAQTLEECLPFVKHTTLLDEVDTALESYRKETTDHK